MTLTLLWLLPPRLLRVPRPPPLLGSPLRVLVPVRALGVVVAYPPSAPPGTRATWWVAPTARSERTLRATRGSSPRRSWWRWRRPRRSRSPSWRTGSWAVCAALELCRRLSLPDWSDKQSHFRCSFHHFDFWSWWIRFCARGSQCELWACILRLPWVLAIGISGRRKENG